MHRINEFIHLDIRGSSTVDRSFCTVAEDAVAFDFTFGLFMKDCLFETLDKDYEIKIRIVKAYFEKYDEPLEISVERQSICCNTQAKLLEVIQCTLQGIHRKLFLESAILFLIHQSQKNNLVYQLDCADCAIMGRPTEVEKIQQARQFIIDHLGENLTIPIIAMNVATNQCYLKKGFKEVFSQTIFEFIQEQRMIKARFLLQSPHPNITDIAYSVGYSSLSSFSQSYKNYFGISPTDQLKQIVQPPLTATGMETDGIRAK